MATPATAAASPVPVAPLRRRRLSSAVVLAVSAVAALAGCAQADAVPPPSAVPATPAVHHDLPTNVRSMLLPTTGEETRWTQGLAAFADAASYRVTDQCVRSKGVAMPDVPPPMFIRLYEIPDLEHIQRYGFQPGRPEIPAPAEGKADRSVQDGCLAEGAAAVKELRETVGQIQLQWAKKLAELRKRPEVVEAYRGFSSCLAGRGLSTMDEETFFGRVDSVAQKGDAAAERALAQTYAVCMAPVEKVREPLRRQLRESFEADHVGPLKLAQHQLVPLMEALRERTGTVIAFPV